MSKGGAHFLSAQPWLVILISVSYIYISLRPLLLLVDTLNKILNGCQSNFSCKNPTQYQGSLSTLKPLIHFIHRLPTNLGGISKQPYLRDWWVQDLYKKGAYIDHKEVTLYLLFLSHKSSGGWCHTLRRPSMFHRTDLHNHKNSGKRHKRRDQMLIKLILDLKWKKQTNTIRINYNL